MTRAPATAETAHITVMAFSLFAPARSSAFQLACRTAEPNTAATIRGVRRSLSGGLRGCDGRVDRRQGLIARVHGLAVDHESGRGVDLAVYGIVLHTDGQSI